MKTANDSMMKMTDAAKKAEAMKEMHTAKGMMARKDEKGCVTHMEKAMGMMTGVSMVMNMQMMAPIVSHEVNNLNFEGERRWAVLKEWVGE